MIRPMAGALTALGVILAGGSWWCRTAAEDEKPTIPVKPGLLVTYRDHAEGRPQDYSTISPTLSLFLKPGESPHPRLAPEKFTARWQGVLRIFRPGRYTFHAHVQGRFRLLIDGKEVLKLDQPAGDPVKAAADTSLELEAGNHELVGEYARMDGPARVQVFWQARHIFPEPIPHDSLGHVESSQQKAGQPGTSASAVALAESGLEDRGRFLAEEHACTACHVPDEKDSLARSLKNHLGPDLSQVGERIHPDWLAAWLQDPARLRPRSTMPRLLSDGPQGKIEAYAIAQYLTSLGGPMRLVPERLKPNDVRTSQARGEKLFNSIGCTACHGANPLDKPASDVHYPISHLGSKTTADMLTRFLQNPLGTHPGGRMPNMLLNGQEAGDLARYLCQGKEPLPSLERPARGAALAAFKLWESREAEIAEFGKLPEDRQWSSLGQRLVIEKRCNGCHTIAPGGKPFAQVQANAGFEDLKKRGSQGKGCLADGQAAGAAPRFKLSTGDRQALQVFLRNCTVTRQALAPIHAAQAALRRFHCLGCHARNGEGGLTTEMTDQLRKFENAEHAEAVSPPPLTGIGAKLQTAWMKQVLTQAGRARPWMGLRMPQFGEQHVGHLPDWLAACDGVEPGSRNLPATSFDPAFTDGDVTAGRSLVSKKVFGCIACHDIAGNPASGTRGPDLALMQQRVRYDWYRRWLVQPQKMQPGTRMPTIFPDGKSLIDDILGGDAGRQADAMWAYLALGANLPLPEGLEPPKGLIIAVKDRPTILRTFMPEAGSKAIAVGFPDQVSVAFDAAACRLAYAWTGNFLDAAPVWNDRGGNPARLLGPRFWESPRGFPWAFAAKGMPDFAAQARDPSFGASLPEGQVYQGPMHLHFAGYATDNRGQPEFRYRVENGAQEQVAIQESVQPLRHPAAVGLMRRFAMMQPRDVTPWLLIGESRSEPRLLDGQGNAMKRNPSQGSSEVEGGAAVLAIGDRVNLVLLGEAPRGTVLQVQKQGDVWQTLVRLPAVSRPQETRLGVSIWIPYHMDESKWRELLVKPAG